ncbi:UvrD/REP helicase [Paraglaciecola sp. T6c]|uniref:UvrD-helicase domain-containing protein n=1 Tax=Pseudoalteromonas atlantica (strain T6c / ATCC BAA-1087) TaxID=3042615 RepID=UPI00005C7506|nr:UvrD-helicase domain-containing protein [Paraglaciecola sp. T6c]ABG39260.1 UvrD/REP helicase [Paraglaciecola sp. T6c]
MTRNDKNLMFSDIENNLWSNKFALKNNSHVDTDLNAVYQSFINNGTLSYKDEPKSLVKLLQDPKHAKYQSKLLSRYFEEPEKYLKLDCDYLSIQVDCSQAKTVELFTNNDTGLLKPRSNALREILTIRHEPWVHKANNGLMSKENSEGERYPKAPIFTSVYRIKLFNDRRKFFYIYIADGTKGLEGKRVQIDFIPSRFTDLELSILFGHIKSVLKKRAYSQFIAKARYKRVDIAFNMPGVFQPFVFPAYFAINSISTGSCWPLEKLVETCYIGNRRSNHYIVYDKILKEMKTDITFFLIEHAEVQQAMKKLAMVTRIERRFYTNRAGHNSKLFQKTIPLSDLPTQTMPLDEIAIIDPIVMRKIDRKLLLKTIQEKSRWQDGGNKEAATRQINEELEGTKVFRLDETVFNTMKTKLLTDLLETIQNPTIIKTDELIKLIKFNHLKKSIELPLPLTKVKKISKAYKSEHHNIVVKSGAGCGKTREIVKRVVWLISEKDVDANKITILAYTNDAVKELKQRIRKKLEKLKPLNGKDRFELPNIKTFSAWCGQQLKRHDKKQYGSSTYMPSEKEKGALTKTREYYLRNIVASNSTIKGKAEDYDRLFSFSANDCKPNLGNLIDSISSRRSKKLKVNAKDARTVYVAYKKLKEKHSLWDFDDVLTFMNKRMKVPKFSNKVSDGCEHLILDEMQDSNLVQWQILEKLSAAGIKLFCVGDTAQSIFGFRGARPARFENYAENTEVKRFTSRHSYRSTSRILRLTNFVRRYTQSLPKKLTTGKSEGDAPELIEHDDLQGLVNDLTSKLTQLLERSHKTEAILILARTTKVVDTISDAITLALKTEKYMPLLKRISVMTMHKAKGLEADVCFVVDPRYSRSSYDTKDEYLRLIYVALTRARTKLIICRKNTSVNFYTDGQEGEPDIIDILKENTFLFA